MKKINTLYNDGISVNRIVTGNHDIVNRTGIIDVNSEISLMERAGAVYQNYVEKVYSDVIGKGGEEDLLKTKNTMLYKETLDMIDEERALHEEIEKNKKEIERKKKENELMKKEIEKRKSTVTDSGRSQAADAEAPTA